MDSAEQARDLVAELLAGLKYEQESMPGTAPPGEAVKRITPAGKDHVIVTFGDGSVIRYTASRLVGGDPE